MVVADRLDLAVGDRVQRAAMVAELERQARVYTDRAAAVPAPLTAQLDRKSVV